MAQKRAVASKSVGELIKLSKRFEGADTKDIINRDICPSVIRILSQFNAPARFTTTMSIFMHFFLDHEVSIFHSFIMLVAPKMVTHFPLPMANFEYGGNLAIFHDMINLMLSCT